MPSEPVLELLERRPHVYVVRVGRFDDVDLTGPRLVILQPDDDVYLVRLPRPRDRRVQHGQVEHVPDIDEDFALVGLALDRVDGEAVTFFVAALRRLAQHDLADRVELVLLRALPFVVRKLARPLVAD